VNRSRGRIHDLNRGQSGDYSRIIFIQIEADRGQRGLLVAGLGLKSSVSEVGNMEHVPGNGCDGDLSVRDISSVVTPLRDATRHLRKINR